MAAAAVRPIVAEANTAIRPAAHSATRAASETPATGRRPVQLGIDVSRKPAATAPP